MDQPNYQRLADAFTTVGQECALFPNIPAVNNSQTLIDVINELRDETRRTAAATTLHFNTLQAEIGTLRTDIGTLRTEITSRLDAK